MRSKVLKRAGAGVLLAGMLAGAWAADEHPVVKRAFDLPPSAELTYALTARQSGFSLGGKAVVTWSTRSRACPCLARSRKTAARG
jgi:hypothetical protein